MLRIVAGSTATSLAQELSRVTGAELVETESRRFPDGEQYVRIRGDVKDQEVVLIQNSYPDSGLIELFLLEDALFEAHAARTTIVIPYLGYARQDRRFNPGEPVSLRALVRRIAQEADTILTVEVHNPESMKDLHLPIRSISGVPPVARYLKSRGVNMVLSPDEGAVRRAQIAAEVIGCEWDFLEKERIDSSTVEITPKRLDVEGKSVAIIDDVISTGGTIATAAKHLLQQGASSVSAGCVHGLFVYNALERLKDLTEVVATDTIVSPATQVSVASEIAPFLTEGSASSR